MVEVVIPVVFVALVRKDMLDHAIWTVAVIPHPVVTDHRHSFKLVSVEAPVIVFPPAGGGARGNPGGSPGESGGPGGQGGAGGVPGGLRGT